ncbi:MAG: hypothetical protein HQM08_09575 [Candidatus Riflebacteria bacterium]|nr:hypothetical protein [Candidatus Riflebacteria bacterium]
MKKIFALGIFFLLLITCAHSFDESTESRGGLENIDQASQVKKPAQETPITFAPLTQGPLHLTATFSEPILRNMVDAADISPDGKISAALKDGAILFSPFNGGPLSSQTTELSSIECLSRGASPLWKWSEDCSFVWTARREVQHPSHFAISGMQAVQIFPKGETRILPPLEHPAGLLDQLLWIDNKGKAFAEFGMKGGYYRPERENPDPTFAMVDASRGSILDSFSIFKFAKEARVTINYPQAIGLANAAMTVLPDGRIKVLLDIPNIVGWVVWTQSEPPRLLANPYPQGLDKQIAMTPDGECILVVQVLRTDGAVVSDTPGKEGYTPGKSVEGTLASLYELNTGKKLWNIAAKITRDCSGTPPAPVISDDGRFALLRIPAEEEDPYIALVSMQDGKTLQRLPIHQKMDSSANRMGFFQNGVWTQEGYDTVLYSWEGGK